jgi:hypothetical protein
MNDTVRACARGSFVTSGWLAKMKLCLEFSAEARRRDDEMGAGATGQAVNSASSRPLLESMPRCLACGGSCSRWCLLNVITCVI